MRHVTLVALVTAALGVLAGVACGNAATVDLNAAPKAVAVRYMQDRDRRDGSEWALRPPGFQRLVSQRVYASLVKSANVPSPKGIGYRAIAVTGVSGFKHVIVQQTIGARNLRQFDVVEKQCSSRWVVVGALAVQHAGKPASLPQLLATDPEMNCR